MKTHMADKVELVWSSAPLEYEQVTLEVLCDCDPVVVVNREKGLDNLQVELFGPTSDGIRLYKLPPNNLIDALIDCRNAMKKSKWGGEPGDGADA
ncbi:MAG TPA: hypothetical protein VF534_21245 [Paraburkholderia sp.]